MSDIERLTGPAISKVLDELAQLRIQVFREFPYLYAGDLAYEREYLSCYATSKNAVVVIVRDHQKIVGASTGLPLNEADSEFQAPFEKPQDWFYFGESVLLPDYRGQGYGHAFFDHREAHADGYKNLCFCAVDRASDHPARPTNYRPLDQFWLARGYQRRPDLQATFEWQDLGQPTPAPHTLTFWTRER